ncbi:hypothetical protein BDQ94DRAFT_168248 [Aspergillus welwitschiae]|uniref:Uncharacterized protein n=1 Tax=Aspergillus welwitschiae TaxID=1341132 RepID=A0A3F3Q9T4_9EURO|nr:hypothetical protein BDQ94DRAFT_168248 [Aspergillus welwitschiae]RDH35929.1 hypothetical protein BDQ94DRAFT_168248 [Aspergillus welwitschiae]
MGSSTHRHESLFDNKLDLEFGTWGIGKNLSSKVRQQEDPQGGFTYERHEAYEATRIDQPSNTPDIIKIKKHDGVYREIYNLSQLEDCRSTPKLLGHAVEKQISSDELPGGYIAYIVMQKVPGENLHGFDTLSPGEQNRIRIAFIEGNCIPVISLNGIHEERISYGSPKAGNALSWILKMSSNVRIEPRMMYVWTHWNN